MLLTKDSKQKTPSCFLTIRSPLWEGISVLFYTTRNCNIYRIEHWETSLTLSSAYIGFLVLSTRPPLLTSFEWSCQKRSRVVADSIPSIYRQTAIITENKPKILLPSWSTKEAGPSSWFLQPYSPPPPPPQKKKEKKRYDIRIQVELGLRCPACRALIIVKRLKDVGRLLER